MPVIVRPHRYMWCLDGVVVPYWYCSAMPVFAVSQQYFRCHTGIFGAILRYIYIYIYSSMPVIVRPHRYMWCLAGVVVPYWYCSAMPVFAVPQQYFRCHTAYVFTDDLSENRRRWRSVSGTIFLPWTTPTAGHRSVSHSDVSTVIRHVEWHTGRGVASEGVGGSRSSLGHVLPQFR